MIFFLTLGGSKLDADGGSILHAVWHVTYNQGLRNVNNEYIWHRYDCQCCARNPEEIQKNISKVVNGDIKILDYKVASSNIDMVSDEILKELLYKYNPNLRKMENEKQTIEAEKELAQNGGMIPRFWNWENKMMNT